MDARLRNIEANQALQATEPLDQRERLSKLGEGYKEGSIDSPLPPSRGGRGREERAAGTLRQEFETLQVIAPIAERSSNTGRC